MVIADDHEMVRHGFRMVLDAQPDMQVAAEAGDGLAALTQVRELGPDILLTDVRMGGIDGIELTKRVLEDDDLDTRVIVVTAFNDDDYVARALQHGACGFLIKRSAATLVVPAIRAALAGDTLISPEVTVSLLQRIKRQSHHDQRLESLTSREREIVSLVAKGLDNHQIADQLFISVGTVKTHVSNISAKLRAHNRVGIAVWAWETGLVSRW